MLLKTQDLVDDIQFCVPHLTESVRDLTRKGNETYLDLFEG